MPFRSAGLCRGRLGEEADFFQRPRPGDHQVMRHQVGVFKEDLRGLAGLHDDALLVEEHLVGNRPNGDHAHAQFAELAADW